MARPYNLGFGHQNDVPSSPLDGDVPWCCLARRLLDYPELLSDGEIAFIEGGPRSLHELARLRTIAERILGPDAWMVNW
jgi:hypothetical protein